MYDSGVWLCKGTGICCVHHELKGHIGVSSGSRPKVHTIGQPLGRSCFVAVWMPPTGRKCSPSVPISDRAKYLISSASALLVIVSY